MTVAMDRHERGEAIVIPVIRRAFQWHGTPFGELNATPPDGRPITQAVDRDQAFLEVAIAVQAAVKRLGGGSTTAPSTRQRVSTFQLITVAQVGCDRQVRPRKTTPSSHDDR